MLAFEVLPELLKDVKSEGLNHAVAEHLEQTKEHVARVERAFRAVGAEPSSVRSEPVAALKAEHDELADNVLEPSLKDLFHAAAAIRTEHFELAAYETLLTLARAMEASEVVELLGQNRDDERAALELLHAESERLAQESTR